MEIQRSDMTERDIDMLSNMMLIFFHAGEKCLQIVEEHFVKEHRASQEYKEIKKRVGKVAADENAKKVANQAIETVEKKVNVALPDVDTLNNTFGKK
jgi:cation transport regulator ChaB